MLERSDPNRSETLLISLLVISMLIWGASWVSAKIIAHYAPPEVTVFYRLALSCVSMLPILLLLARKGLLAMTWDRLTLVSSAAAGVLLAAYNQLFFVGLMDGLPGKGGMLVTTLNPIFTVLLTCALFKHKVSTRQTTGLFAGLIGGLLMIEFWLFDAGQLMASGNLFFILAAFTWALLTLVSQKGGQASHFLLFSAFMYFWASVISYVFSFQHDPMTLALSLPMEYWWHMLFLSVVVISIATSVYFLAAQKVGSNKASSYVLIVPVSAVSFSAIILGEVVHTNMLIGGALALFAVLLINSSKKQKTA